MRLALLGLVAAVAVLAVVAALSTPVTAVAQNPYVVGGELELPKAAAGGADAALVAALTVAAIAVGLAALKFLK